MQAGRELDAEIAEKVFGCKVKRPPTPGELEGLSQADYEKRRRETGYHCECPGRPHTIDDGDYYGTDIKEYSTRIQDAWEVVEKLGLLNQASEYNGLQLWRDTSGMWHVGDFDSGLGKVEVCAETPSLAICRAALLFCGVYVFEKL